MKITSKEIIEYKTIVDLNSIDKDIVKNTIYYLFLLKLYILDDVCSNELLIDDIDNQLFKLNSILYATNTASPSENNISDLKEIKSHVNKINALLNLKEPATIEETQFIINYYEIVLGLLIYISRYSIYVRSYNDVVNSYRRILKLLKDAQVTTEDKINKHIKALQILDPNIKISR